MASQYLLSSPVQGNWSQILVEFNAQTKRGKNTATASSYSREENGAREVSVPCTYIFVFIFSFSCVLNDILDINSHHVPLRKWAFQQGVLCMFQVMYRA